MLTKKITASLLVLAMLLPALTGCGGAEDETAETADTTADTTPVETETERIYKDNLPDNLDFGGAAVKFLWWEENEEYAEEQTGEVVNDALYDRDLSVEERLNVDVVNIGESYTWDTRDIYLGKIRASVMANDGSYDVVSCQYATLPALVPEGNFTDMNTLPYLDFSNTYWVQQLLEETSINGKLYLASGDITLMTVSSVFCIMYNETLRQDLGIENLVDVVNAGEWTSDKMNEIIEGTYADLDGNAAPSAGDRYGIAFVDDNSITPFIQAFDLRITTMDETGYPQLSFNSERAVSAAEYLISMLQSQDAMVDLLNTDNYEKGVIESNMLAGNILLYITLFKSARTLIDMDDEFGLLPMPKWDIDQQNYQTALGESNTLVGILSSAADKEASAATLEAMAAESSRLVTPALYEITLKTRYSKDSEMSKMFDLIREGVTFNFGSIYTYDLNRLNIFFKETVANKRNWASSWASQEDATKAAIDKFITSVSELEH